MQHPTDIGGQLLCFWSRQNHTVTQRVQELAPADPLLFLHKVIVHDSDLSCGPSETDKSEFGPEFQCFPECWLVLHRDGNWCAIVRHTGLSPGIETSYLSGCWRSDHENLNCILVQWIDANACFVGRIPKNIMLAGANVPLTGKYLGVACAGVPLSIVPIGRGKFRIVESIRKVWIIVSLRPTTSCLTPPDV